MAMGRGNESFETHLIEEDGTLNCVELDTFLKKVNLAECGLKYAAVVSIMGPQSSGKSTLLNHLFGSNFQELDGNERRGKTTKGIWIARCVGVKPCTLVMDVEGCDGRERGEDAAFEKRSGIFAFALSQIVLINMVSNSVGLEQGASKPLLRHVFRGVLRLSSGPRKITLMFVIRDIVRTTPLDILEPILREDIKKIWDSIPKPEGHKRTPFDTFFKVEVVGLPNYVDKEKEFKEQVKSLRRRFNHFIAPGGLAGDSRQTILCSDFSLGVQKIWTAIKEDPELDLPNHEVMIANTRCGEIANKKLKEFDANKERRQLEEGAQTNIPARGFGKKYKSIINSYLHGYDKETEYYDVGVKSEKKKHLEEEMMLSVQSALLRIVAQIRSRTLEEFKKAYQNAMKRGKDATVTGDNCKEACMKSFDDRCAEVIVEQANCDTSEARKKLQQEIDYLVLQVKLEQSEKKFKALENKENSAAITDEKFKALETDEKLKGNAIATGIAVGVGGAVLGTAVAGGAVAMATIGLPVTVIAVAAAGVFAGVGAVGTLIGKTVKAYKSKDCKISRSELEATELKGKRH